MPIIDGAAGYATAAGILAMSQLPQVAAIEQDAVVRPRRPANSGATIVDVQVLDRNGNGRISSILRGIEWVLAHQVQFNIRVINLSFGAVAPGSYKTDPLAAGVEIAWKQGLG